MIFCFDTSALNSLLDDSSCEQLVRGLLANGSFHISAYNVMEAVKTKDPSRRIELVGLMKKLARNTRPLDRPREIVCLTAKAYATGEDTVSVNADPRLEGVWEALNLPENLDEKARECAIAWFGSMTTIFDSIASEGRDPLQRIYGAAPVGRPRTAADAIRDYCSDHERLYNQ